MIISDFYKVKCMKDGIKICFWHDIGDIMLEGFD